jgi:hypothetical protein
MVAPTPIKPVAKALPSLGKAQIHPPPATDGKIRSSCTNNCLAKAALTRPLSATAIVPICSELTNDQDMGSMELLAILIKVEAPRR